MGDHVVLGEHDSLGTSGGARAVHDQAGVVRLDVRLTVDGLARGEPGLELVVLAADDDDLLHGGELAADQLDGRQQLVADEEHPGAGVVDDVVELVSGQPPVDDGVRRTDEADGLGRHRGSPDCSCRGTRSGRRDRCPRLGAHRRTGGCPPTPRPHVQRRSPKVQQRSVGSVLRAELVVVAQEGGIGNDSRHGTPRRHGITSAYGRTAVQGVSRF